MSDPFVNELQSRLRRAEESDEVYFEEVEELQEYFFDICDGVEFKRVDTGLNDETFVIPPPWLIGMSQEFRKDIQKHDKRLQGRILEAITHISDSRLEPNGDTLKPLTGELKGCWRFRIGDYRLVFKPDRKLGRIVLLAFAGRGSIYLD